MPAPDFKAVRQEIKASFNGVTLLQSSYDYRPLSLQGRSPILWIEDAGFRAFLPYADVREFDLAYFVVVAVNIAGHGAQAAAELFDDVREAVVAIIANAEATHTAFDALQMPDGEYAITSYEIIDGLQYLVGRIPVLALDASCDD